jgi:hypothetical protein
MKTFEVKAWVTVRGTDERDALAKAAALLDLLPSDTLSSVSLEGSGSVYEIEDDGRTAQPTSMSL